MCYLANFIVTEVRQEIGTKLAFLIVLFMRSVVEVWVCLFCSIRFFFSNLMEKLTKTNALEKSYLK